MYDYDVHTGEVFDARTGTTHLVARDRATALQLCALLSGVVTTPAASFIELFDRCRQLARALH